MPRLFKSLYFQVIVAILIGISIGALFPETGEKLKPFGDGFIRLVKMMITPVVFCTIVVGIADMKNLRKVGRVGIKALVYFEVITTLALVVGLLVINLLKPGAGMNVDPSTLDGKAVAGYVSQGQATGAVDFILHIIPENIMGAFATGNLLQVLFFSILFGIALARIGGRADAILKGIKSLEAGLFAVINIIMRVAPLGAFGAMAFTIGKYGLGSLASLGQLMISFYITCLLFILIILGGVMRLAGFRLIRLLGFIKDEILVVLGTSSSEAALPSLMMKLEKTGCSEPAVGLVVPTGYSFNLDGTSIYMTMAAVFLAQATNTPLTVSDQLGILLVLLLVSKGSAGVTGSGFITLAALLPVTGHIPVAALSLILGIDRFMSEARAITNIIGNSVATIFIARWEKEINLETARQTIGPLSKKGAIDQ